MITTNIKFLPFKKVCSLRLKSTNPIGKHYMLYKYSKFKNVSFDARTDKGVSFMG